MECDHCEKNELILCRYDVDWLFMYTQLTPKWIQQPGKTTGTQISEATISLLA